MIRKGDMEGYLFSAQQPMAIINLNSAPPFLPVSLECWYIIFHIVNPMNKVYSLYDFNFTDAIISSVYLNEVKKGYCVLVCQMLESRK